MKGAGESPGWSSWSLSILLHALVLAALGGVWYWTSSKPAAEQRLAIEATVVTSVPAAAELPAEPAPQPEADAVQQQLEAEREAAAEAEAQAQAEAKAEAERVAAERVAEQRRVAEARLAEQRKADEAARLKAVREEADRKKKEREQREREQKERERLAREQAEQQRRQRELEEADRARLQRETELNAQIAAEERANAARAGAAGRQYIAQIRARIESNWKRPPGATPGTQCEIRVTQIPGGVVTGVEVVRCNRDDTVRQSIEDAVYRSSPLPQPSDSALFDRNLTITFRPEN